MIMKSLGMRVGLFGCKDTSFLENIYTFAPMNCDDEIVKRKLYYDGLKRVINDPIPKKQAKDVNEAIEDEETDENLKETLRLWKEVFAPLCNAIVFIHNNRFLLDEKNDIINEDAADQPFMLPDEIFKTLKTLLKTTVMEFLSVLPVGSSEKKDLFDKIEQDDMEGFRTLLEESRCDTTALAKLCVSCLDDSFNAENIEDEDFPYLLDYMADRLEKSEADDRDLVLEAVKQWQPSSELINTDDSDETLCQYFSDYRHFIETNLGVYLHYYWDWYDDFLLKERNLIEPILDNPLAKDLVDQVRESYKASLEFALPDDFFHSKCAADDTEHLHLKLSVEDKGAALFADFINYVAERGYIEDNLTVKTLFAYRLTGYYRPEGELPTIVWNGKNGKSYELIYIIRYLCDVASYKKMRLFFEGPEWVKEKDSGYALSADYRFKLKMSEFFPGICPF